MEYRQKKGGNRTHFEFESEYLEYELQEKAGTDSFRVAYSALPYRVHEFIERNEWLRNVGLLWLLIGILITGWRLSESILQLSMWIPIGLGCLGWYWFSIVRYSTLQTGEGKIFVIRDAQHDRILEELLARRVDQLKRSYAFVDHDNDPANELRKFQWLLDNRVIDEAEFETLKAEVENPALTIHAEESAHSIN